MVKGFNTILYPIVFSFVLVVSVQANSLDQNCHILAAVSNSEIVFLAPSETKYEEVARLPGTAYWIAPNQNYIAIERSDVNGMGNAVIIYDLLEGTPTEKKVVPDVAFIRGSAWSPDSQQLLLQDAHSNFLLYLYDLSSDTLNPIFQVFDPGLKVYQVSWNDAGNLIALAARESPFPETDFEDVTALYILDPTSLAYYPVSSPDENVDYYFGNFYWLTTDEIAFTSCSTITNDCQIKFADLNGSTPTELVGNYWLRGYNKRNLLLAIDLNSLDEDIGERNLVVINVDQQTLSVLLQLPVDPVTPLPLYSVSPDFSLLSYVDNTGHLVIVSSESSIIFKMDVETEDAGAWNPNSDQLLFQSGTYLYMFDVEIDQIQAIFSISEDTSISSSRWLCLSRQH